MTLEVPLVVEGDTDVPFAQKVIRLAGGQPGTPYVQRGKPNLLRNLTGYANAARNSPWLVLVDLDQDHSCAPSARQVWEPSPARRLALRVVVRSIEAWALGDRAAIERFFRVRASEIPARPETVADPKDALIELARNSTRREVVTAMAPRPRSGRRQGAGYEARLIEFGQSHWSPEAARRACPSLDRTLKALARMIAEA